MATSVVHDKIVIDLTSDTSSDSGDSDSGSVLTVYTNWPTGHEDEDEAAEKIYTCLQGKLEDHSEDFSIFQKVPFSELPVLFEVPENVIVSNLLAVQPAISPLLTIPHELLLDIFNILADTDAACLASTCKHLARISRSITIVSTREYFIRRGFLTYGTDMCRGCHKNRPTTAEFWRRNKNIIDEWIDPLVAGDREEYSEMIEDCIFEWTMGSETNRKGKGPGGTTVEDSFTEVEEQSMEILKKTCRKRAVIKCPSCVAQDCYEIQMLEFFVSEHDVSGDMYDSVMALARDAQSLGEDSEMEDHDSETDEDDEELDSSEDDVASEGASVGNLVDN